MAYDLVIKNGMVIDGSGLPRYPRRRRGEERAHRLDRPHPRERARDARRRRPRGRARHHRRPHAHGRADLLGSARDVLLLARRHHRRHGQLRLHARAVRREGQGDGDPQPPAGRGHLARGDGGRHQVEVDDLPRVARRARRAAEGHQLLGLPRPLRAAHVRDGRARVRAAGERRRHAAHGSRAARRPRRPARWASRRRGRRVTRRRIAGPSRAASPRGTRCAGSST